MYGAKSEFFRNLLEASLLSRQEMFQMCHDPLRRFAVPFGRNRALLPLSRHQACQRGWQFPRIGSDQFIGADRNK